MDNQRLQSALKTIMAYPVIQQIQAVLSDLSLPAVHLVGGALRDSWIKRPVIDFDFVIDGEARKLGRIIAEKMAAHYVLLDEQWGVVRLIWPEGNHMGRQSLLDFTPMRGSSIQADLAMRDFTINAIAIEMKKYPGKTDIRWKDPYNGLEDLKAGVVRMIHPNRLREDPLRLLRAFRLACSLHFRIEPATMETIAAEKLTLASTASERVRDEIYKILASPDSYKTLRQMDQSGILTIIFPELEDLKGLGQGPYHHADAWEHTLETCRIIEQGLNSGFSNAAVPQDLKKAWISQLTAGRMSAKPIIMLAALLHDIGKPAAAKVDSGGENHFYGHARLGAAIASDISERLRTSRKDRERMKRFIQYHMGPLHLQHARERQGLTDRAMIRFLHRIGKDLTGLLLISWADREASRGIRSSPKKKESFHDLLASLFTFYQRLAALKPQGAPLITGKNLIEELNLSPGPLIGRLLRLIEEERLLGHVNSREEALSMVKKRIGK